MVSSRQGKSISKAAGSRSLCGCLDLDGNSDQLHLVDSRAVEVTQSTRRKHLWLVGWWGWKIWEPTSGLFLPPPPLQALLLLLQALSLSSGQWPLPHALNTPTLRALVLSPRAQPLLWPRGVHLQYVSPPLILSICVWLLSSVLFTHKHDSIPTLQVN